MLEVQRLIFGCGRLTGGVSSRDAENLVSACLANGVKRFDTAPTYGLGTAEVVLGRSLGNCSSSLITVKVGLPRPSMPFGRTVARRIKRAISPSKHAELLPISERPPLQSAGVFRKDFLLKSLHISLRNLRRDRVDVLLLHEFYDFCDCPDIWDFFSEVKAQGLTAVVGYSHGSFFHATTDTLFSEGHVAQFAVSFRRPFAMEPQDQVKNCLAGKKVFMHSIIKSALLLAQKDADFAKALENGCKQLLPYSRHQRTALAVFLFAVAAEFFPKADLIFSFSTASEIDGFIDCIGNRPREISSVVQSFFPLLKNGQCV